jgi:hypothetical protein
LLLVWTVWLVAALLLLRDDGEPGPGPGLLVFFAILGAVLLGATSVTWRGYLIGWLAAHVVLTGIAVGTQRQWWQIVTGAVSLSGLLWLWADGGWRYGWQVATAAAVTALAALGLCGYWIFVRRPRPQSEAEAARRQETAVSQPAVPRPGAPAGAHWTLRAANAAPSPTQTEQVRIPVRPAGTSGANASAGQAANVTVTRLRVGYVREPWLTAPGRPLPPARYYLSFELTAAGLPPDRAGHLDVVLDRCKHARDNSAARDRFVDAVSDYAADRIEASAVDPVMRLWVTRDAYDIDGLAQALERSDAWLHSLIKQPFAAAVPGPGGEIVGGVAGNLALRGVDGEIQGITRVCEYAGIAVGLATGLHPLAMACVKHLAHDQIGREISAAVSRVIGGPDEPGGREPPFPGPEPPSPIGPRDRGGPSRNPAGPGFGRTIAGPADSRPHRSRHEDRGRSGREDRGRPGREDGGRPGR